MSKHSYRNNQQTCYCSFQMDSFAPVCSSIMLLATQNNSTKCILITHTGLLNSSDGPTFMCCLNKKCLYNTEGITWHPTGHRHKFNVYFTMVQCIFFETTWKHWFNQWNGLLFLQQMTVRGHFKHTPRTYFLNVFISPLFNQVG